MEGCRGGGEWRKVIGGMTGKGRDRRGLAIVMSIWRASFREASGSIYVLSVLYECPSSH